MRKHASHGTSPRPVETKSQPRRGPDPRTRPAHRARPWRDLPSTPTRRPGHHAELTYTMFRTDPSLVFGEPVVALGSCVGVAGGDGGLDGGPPGLDGRGEAVDLGDVAGGGLGIEPPQPVGDRRAVRDGGAGGRCQGSHGLGRVPRRLRPTAPRRDLRASWLCSRREGMASRSLVRTSTRRRTSLATPEPIGDPFARVQAHRQMGRRATPGLTCCVMSNALPT